MSDLKLIDELLIEMLQHRRNLNNESVKQFVQSSSTVEDALTRLRSAWINGEMQEGITKTWADYFRSLE